MQNTPRNRFPISKLSIKNISPRIIITLACLIIFLVCVFWGVINGISAANREIKELEEVAKTASLGEQFILAQEDIAARRFNIAQQRLVYILDKDPNFPGVAEKLLEVITEMNLTGETVTIFIEPTITPTPDNRPVDQLFEDASKKITNREWQTAIDTLTSLRKSDPKYKVSQVDDYLYLALRYLGVEKIMLNGDLEGGIYNLALAEQFGPLDAEASNSQYYARMYMYGLAFWKVNPEQAVYYFSQVANASPYMRDGSGYTARMRYREALIQYGDKFADNDKWCEAVAQYSLALSIEADASLQNKITDANNICSPPTETPGLTATITPTVTETPIIYISTATPTSTLQMLISNTPAPSTATPTNATISTEAPTPTIEPTQAPLASDTPEPTAIPPTDAPTEAPTEALIEPTTEAAPGAESTITPAS